MYDEPLENNNAGTGALGRLRQAEFEASLVYISSFRPANIESLSPNKTKLIWKKKGNTIWNRMSKWNENVLIARNFQNLICDRYLAAPRCLPEIGSELPPAT